MAKADHVALTALSYQPAYAVSFCLDRHHMAQTCLEGLSKAGPQDLAQTAVCGAAHPWRGQRLSISIPLFFLTLSSLGRPHRPAQAQHPSLAKNLLKLKPLPRLFVFFCSAPPES